MAVMVDEGQTMTQAARDATPLRIVHVMRAPVGGLFRHVVDLARAQAEAGCLVGVVADSATGGEAAARVFADLAPALALGVTRLEMRRLPHPSDAVAAYTVARLLARLAPDVVHGHGAKGGLYARLPALAPGFPTPARRILRAYTPHGGSLHFSRSTLGGRALLYVERMLERVTDLITFESAFARQRYVELIGLAHALAPVVRNGLAEHEFDPAHPLPEAADFLYVGELRRCKGVDTLIEALALIGARKDSCSRAAPRLALVGSGPDEAVFRALAQERGVATQLSFLAPMKGRDAFRHGRVIVAPSRAESLPYIVLEAIAARLPIVAADVGGIPEIFGPHASRLVPSDDPQALARAMIAMGAMDEDARKGLADELAAFVRQRFTLSGMAEGVLRGYRDAMRRAASLEPDSANTLPRHV